MFSASVRPVLCVCTQWQRMEPDLIWSTHEELVLFVSELCACISVREEVVLFISELCACISIREELVLFISELCACISVRGLLRFSSLSSESTSRPNWHFD